MILRQSSQEKICVVLFVSFVSSAVVSSLGGAMMSLDVNYAGGDVETFYTLVGLNHCILYLQLDPHI